MTSAARRESPVQLSGPAGPGDFDLLDRRNGMIDLETSTRQEIGAKLAWPLAVFVRCGGWITGVLVQRVLSEHLST